MQRSKAATVSAVLALGLTLGCTPGGQSGPRNSGDARLTTEQRTLLDRYGKLVTLAKSRARAREYQKALQALADAEVVAGRIHGPGHAIFAQTQDHKARVLVAMARFELAAAAYEKSLALWRKALDPGDNIVVARTLHHIGRAWFFAGDMDKAADYLTRAIAMRRATVGKEPRRIGKSYVETSKRPREPGLADALHALGLVRWKQKQHDQAAKVLGEAAQLRRKHLRPGHLDLLQSLLSLAQLNEIRRQHGVAEKLYLELVNRVGRRKRPASSVLASGLKHLGDLYRRTKRFPQAERYYAQARRVTKEAKRFARREVYQAQIDMSLATVFARTKREAKAEKMLRSAIKVFAAHPKVLANHAIRCHIHLTELYRQQKKLDKAMKAVRTALNLASQHLGPRTYAYARALTELSEVYLAQKEAAHAAKLLHQAFEIVHKTYGASHPRTRRIRARLVKLYRVLKWTKKEQDLPK